MSKKIEDGNTQDGTEPELDLQPVRPEVDVDAEGGVHDMESLAVSPEEMQLTPGELVITRIPVKKPDASVFFRVRPRNYPYYISLKVKDNRDEWYLIAPKLAAQVPEARPTLIYEACARPSSLFAWPVFGHDPATGDLNSSYASQHDAAQLARTDWMSIRWYDAQKMYEIKRAPASATIPEPVWPDMPYTELLKKAFRNRIIRDIDHPVLKRLRGEI